LRASNKREVLTPGRVVPATENYHRATLHFDGVFVLYSHPKNSSGNESWSVVRTMPVNICTDVRGKKGTGPCGFNGVCTISTDQRAICRCPQRFSLLDPDDPYGGCKPDFRHRSVQKMCQMPQKIMNWYSSPILIGQNQTMRCTLLIILKTVKRLAYKIASVM